MCKIGDKIVLIGTREKAEIINKYENRFLIKFSSLLTVSGTCVEYWTSGDLFEIDKEYYRELKINKIIF